MTTLMVIIAIVGLIFLGISLFINFTADNTDAKAMAVLPFMFSLGIFFFDACLWIVTLLISLI